MISNFFRSVTLSVFGLVAISIFTTSIVILPIYAQTDNDVVTSEQFTLSDDLANNPLAQDILKKIEQTKKWIAELEQRNYEQLEKQKELEEKRTQALAKLNEDLKEWEKLWEYYSPRNSFERFVDKIPDSQVQSVFWDQFEFKEQKVKAGRDALKKVISNGGSLQEARQAYLTAAETKRIELIEANSQFNVRHNLAYYNQQILFDREGQFVDSSITGEQLRKYYEDFRTNPAYLNANPDDDTSWEERSRTDANTECRDGQIIVYRFHADDYVCVTMETAEMWVRHGMGEIMGDSIEISSRYQQAVSPITRCDEGFMVIYNIESKKYSCVLEDTAHQWVKDEIAEFHDPEEYIVQSIERKKVLVEIEEVNQQIRNIRDAQYDEKLALDKEYDARYDAVLSAFNQAEKDAVKEYNDNSDMSKSDLSQKILDIREEYESEKKDILRDKIRDTKKLEADHESQMERFAQKYDDNVYFMVISNHGSNGYEAVLRE